jgi:hypothetical protein
MGACRRAAQRKLMLQANRRPPSLVDVNGGRHRDLRAACGDSGPGPACACTAVAAYARALAQQLLHTPQLLHPARTLGEAGAWSGVGPPPVRGVWWRAEGPAILPLTPRAPAGSASAGRDPYSRRPVECLAVRAEGRTVHRLVACAAGPGGVSAAVAEAGLMPYEYFAGAEGVPVRASRRRVGDPLPGRGLY